MKYKSHHHRGNFNGEKPYKSSALTVQELSLEPETVEYFYDGKSDEEVIDPSRDGDNLSF